MKLPEAFIDRLKEERPDDYEVILASFDAHGFHGLRVNTLKISVNDFVKIFPYELRPVPWTSDGFYYNEADPVTKHPFYHAGLYYIQEPSAMSPVGTLKPKLNDFCVDLCAAPGGKSLQLATAIGEHGFLVSNDISDKRVKAIVRNVERFGLRNIIVLNESPDRIAEFFGNYFDYALIDAPCSGEGMFRRDDKAIAAWETYDNAGCASIQKSILDAVPHMVKSEGKVTYSTCTFAYEENENQVNDFMARHVDFIPESMPERLIDGIEYNGGYQRLWPHKISGEGHFIAHIKRTSTGESDKPALVDKAARRAISKKQLPKGVSPDAPESIATFMKEFLKMPLKGLFKTVKEKVYLLPEYELDLTGLKIAREGVLLGEIKKNRFMPSQALALYLKADQFHQILELAPDSSEVIKYLKCETLHVDISSKGLHLVSTAGFPLGFCKVDKGVVKNMYPATWRLM